jgi:hypothetical protein
VNREHLAAFVWLRWRLRANQFRKAGAVNAALFFAFLALGLSAAVSLLFVGFGVGMYALRGEPPHVHLFVWGGVVLALLFFWMIGLLTDLQRTDSLALDRFLHLPVSPAGAFLINYLSSLVSLTLIVFAPGMVGLLLGSAVAVGPVMLLGLPLAGAMFFALTAVTYQFQGWLASLMTNPRRRRTVIVVVTGAFILVSQAPQLIHVFRPWEAMTEPINRKLERLTDASTALQAGRITADDYKRRQQEIEHQYESDLKENEDKTLGTAVRTARLCCTILPPGWLPLGVEGLAGGVVFPALLGTLGLVLLGSVSLWRAYRTTLRIYTGQYTAESPKPAATATPEPSPDPTRVRLVERRLPWVSESVSAVATAAFRSLIRAPEAKMAFLAPLIMVVVFAGIAASSGGSLPVAVRPLLAYGAGGMILLIAGLQLLGNMFGYDRAGFRAYILSPAPRRDVLFGKNLAVAPILLGLGLLGAAVAGCVFPMRVDHYPAVVLQLLSTYLLLCLATNVVAILTPVPLAPGSLQPAKITAGPVLMQFALMMVLPVLVMPVLAPFGLELLLAELDVVKGVPVSLPLSVVVLGLVVLLYRWLIRIQGDWLGSRELAILEVVTSRAE